MKIAILQSSYDKSDAATKEFDLPYDPRPWLVEHNCEVFQLDKNEASEKLPAIWAQGFDVVINLCDGAEDEDRAGIEVVRELTKLGIPFTGAKEGFYEPTRTEMKAACIRAGIGSPQSYLVRKLEELVVSKLPFPLIVKHPNSYNSVGLIKDSVVHTCLDLETQVARIIDFFGEALVETYIAGKEFTVLLSGDAAKNDVQAYPPVEFVFPEGETFKHFNLKWKDFEDMSTRQVEDADLSERLMDISRKHFLAMGGVGYARTDIRMNEKGELFILEINPNCSIFYPPESAGSADEILLKLENGHRDFLKRIIEVALRAT